MNLLFFGKNSNIFIGIRIYGGLKNFSKRLNLPNSLS